MTYRYVHSGFYSLKRPVKSFIIIGSIANIIMNGSSCANIFTNALMSKGVAIFSHHDYIIIQVYK